MVVSRARSPRYIAIEGPIGVGKTTLACELAKRLGARTLLEEFEGNPFLRAFYRDRSRAAFQTQVYFLLARYKQQEALRQTELFSRATVSDYLFAKDRIFAYLNLSEPELQLYERIYALLRPRLLSPDMVIFLQAPPEVLLRRLRRRGEAEAPADISYLEAVVRAYSDFFHTYDEAPLLVVDASNLDFVSSPAELDTLAEMLAASRPGRRLYAPPAESKLPLI
jgi:deoxyguanosine kinase